MAQCLFPLPLITVSEDPNTTPRLPSLSPARHRGVHSLAIGLQLADLKVDKQVILAVAGPRAGPS